MTADKPSPVVPKLRFSEFRDASAWEQTALGTLLDRPPEYGANAAAVPFSEDLPAYIRITDIDDDGRFVPAPRVSVDIKPGDDQFLQPGDIVFARTGASVGKSYRHRGAGGRLVYAGFLIRVRPNPDRLSSQFLAAYLSTWAYWDWVRLTSARSGQPGINGTEYASMPLPLPPAGRDLAEQQKIASFFGSLEDLIADKGRKLEALRQHKQGLMQQLFPQPDETAPRLRFPEFQDAPDWKTARCRDIAKVLTGYGFPNKFQGNKKGQYPFYKVSDISQTIEKEKRHISEANNYIDSDVLDKIRGKPVPAGTIIFAKIGEAIRSNRRAVTTKPAVIDNNTAGIKAMKAKNSDEFLFYLWSKVSLIDHAGGVVPAVSKLALENVPLCYPIDPAEQQCIADCLSSVDDLISAQARNLVALQTHRRGLLQQLFPSLDGQ